MKIYTQVDNTVELYIRPEMETELRKVFAQEMNGGFKGISEDGRQHYLFNIPADKALLLHYLSNVLCSSSDN